MNERLSRACGDEDCPKVHVRAVAEHSLGCFHTLAHAREFLGPYGGGVMEVLRALGPRGTHHGNTVMLSVPFGTAKKKAVRG